MNIKLTSLQAYCAMFHFLDIYCAKTNSESICGWIGDLQFLQSSQHTADPKSWLDWEKAIEKIYPQKNSSFTPQAAYLIMYQFLNMRFNIHDEETDSEIKVLIDEMQLINNSTSKNPYYWELWEQCIKTILSKKDPREYLTWKEN